MNRTTLLVLAMVLLARVASADDLPPPPQPPPGQAASPAGPPVQAPSPGYSAPVYAPTYAPPPRAYEPMVMGPERITDFDEDAPVPYGYTKVTRTRKGAVIGGAIAFGVSYGLTALTGAIGEELRTSGETNTSFTALYIPVAGPFLQLGKTDSDLFKFYMIYSGAVQSVGAVLLLYGLTTPRTILVRNDRLSFAPMLGNGASGMTLLGRF